MKDDEYKKDVIKFATTCPKVRRTPSRAVDDENERKRAKLVELVGLCLKNSDHIADTLDYMQERIVRQNPLKSVVANPLYFGELTTLAKVNDFTWLANYLISRSKLTMNDLQLMKSFDPMSIKHLICRDTHVSLGVMLPVECKEKALLARVLSILGEKNGNCLADVALKAGVTEDGKVLWKEVGPYSFTKENDHVTAIAYKSHENESVDVRAEEISSKWKLMEAWNQEKARFVNGSKELVIESLFARKTGPHRKPYIKGSRSVLHVTVDEIVMSHKVTGETDAIASASSSSSPIFVDNEAVARAKTNAAKAREALVKRNKQMAKNRQEEI